MRESGFRLLLVRNRAYFLVIVLVLVLDGCIPITITSTITSTR